MQTISVWQKCISFDIIPYFRYVCWYNFVKTPVGDLITSAFRRRSVKKEWSIAVKIGYSFFQNHLEGFSAYIDECHSWKKWKKVWWQNATFHVYDNCFLISHSYMFMHVIAMTDTYQLTSQQAKLLPGRSETAASAAWTRFTGTILHTWWNYTTERIHIAIRIWIFQYDYTMGDFRHQHLIKHGGLWLLFVCRRRSI